LTVYPDTSFVMPLYLVDTHSPEAWRRMALRPSVFLTPFHRAEVANAMFQQVFRGQLSNADAIRAFAEFERDCSAGIWTVADQSAATFAVSIDLARRHVPRLGVRTLDMLHVAAAIELKADRFWTFDQRQARLAEAEGLPTS
jgi:predicted nucleic acid-binding protein